MTTNNADWANTGVRFAKPHWEYGKPSAPISHSMNKPVEVEFVLDVYPRDAGSTGCKITGTSQFGGLTFAGAGSIKGGEQTFTAKAGTLPDDKVQKLTGDIQWKVDTDDDGPFDAGASWKHTVYDILGDPNKGTGLEEGITQKRMETAVRLVNTIGSKDPHTIIWELLKLFQSYTLIDAQPPRGVSPAPTGPWTYGHCKYFNNIGGAWPLIDYVSNAAQCQAIVRFVRAVARQVGCPGDAQIMLVYAHPNVNNGGTVLEDDYEKVGGDQGMGGLNGNPHDPDPARQGHPKSTANGVPVEAYLPDSDPVREGNIFDTEAGPGANPPYIGPNNYEACLKFTANGITKYYGGGMPDTRFDTKEQVLSGAFPTLVWLSFQNSPPGHTFIRIEKIIKRAPW
jgi:hypothetical protein